MANIGALVVDLQANSARFVQEMEKARAASERAAAGMQRGLDSAKRAFEGVQRAANLLAGALGIGAIGAFISNAMRLAGELADVAQTLGLSTDALQAWRYAASQSGVSAEQLDQALTKFSDTLNNASRGNDEAIRTFQRLNIMILDTAGQVRPAEDVLLEFAEAVSRIENPVERLGAVSAAFGDRMAARLVPLLSEGRAGFERFAREAQAAGAIISRDVIDAAKRSGDEFERNVTVIRAWGATIGVYAVNRIGELMTALGQLSALFNQVWQAAQGPAAVRRLMGDPLQQAQDRVTGITQNLRERQETLRQLEAVPEHQRGPNWFGQRFFARNQIEDAQEELRRAREEFNNLRVMGGETFGPNAPPRRSTGAGNPTGQQAGRNRAQETERQTQALDRLLRSLNPVLDAQRDYADALAILDTGLASGALNVDQYGVAVVQLGGRFDEAMKSAARFAKPVAEAVDRMADLRQAGEDLGKSLSSTIEGAIIKWEGFYNLLGAIGQDIGRILIRLAITEPLSRAISAGFGSLFGTGSSGASSSASIGGGQAMGGVLTGRGAVPLARGGIATHSTLYEIGEGSMNEAVVPLPDGRKIPVDMRGGRGGGGVTINMPIDARGSERGTELRIRAAAEWAVGRALEVSAGAAQSGGRYARAIGTRK